MYVVTKSLTADKVDLVDAQAVLVLLTHLHTQGLVHKVWRDHLQTIGT